MRVKIILLLFLTLLPGYFLSVAQTQDKYTRTNKNTSQYTDYQTFRFFINNFNLPINNRGVLADVNIPDENPQINGAGGKYANIIALFSGGFALSGYSGNLMWTNGVMPMGLVEDYQSGPIGSVPEDPKNLIYVLKSDDPAFSASWQLWKDAVSIGARFYDGDNDGIYNPVDKNGNNIWDANEDRPDLMGDLTAWCVYNDGIPANLRRFNIPPQNIEVMQSVFASRWGTEPAFQNTVFVRYSIVNKNAQVPVMDSVYFGVNGDPDLGFPMDDSFGTDTLCNSAIAYNKTPDSQFGINAPSLFTKIVQGPLTYIPGVTFTDINQNGIYDQGTDIPLDTAYNRLGSYLGTEVYAGAKNLQVTGSRDCVGGDPNLQDPGTALSARNYIMGLINQGYTIDPCTFGYGIVTGGVDCSAINPLIYFSGDPVLPYGWLSNFSQDIRSMISAGPFKLEFNKPVDIITAYVIGRGTTGINSITVTRGYSSVIDNSYKSNFSNLPTKIEDNSTAVWPAEYSLSQNYPNPFNPETVISYQLAVMSNVSLKLFDILGNEITTLVNEEKEAGSYEVDFNADKLPGGIYFYCLRAGSFVETKKMILLK